VGRAILPNAAYFGLLPRQQAISPWGRPSFFVVCPAAQQPFVAQSKWHWAILPAAGFQPANSCGSIAYSQAFG
jgi:hypothetical protein